MHPSKVPGGNELINAQKVLEKAGIEEGMKVGDLGCGARGYFTIQAAKLVGKKGLVYGVDIIKPSLQSLETIAKMHGVDNLKTVWSDLEVFGGAKAIRDEILDFALIINVFFQSKKHLEILKETARMLKKEGKLLVIDWKKTGAPFGPPVSDRVSREEIKKAADLAGFEAEKEFEAGPYHWAVVFTKE